LAKKEPVPQWQLKMKRRVLLARTTGALLKANETIDKTHDCQVKQREGFAGVTRDEK
jgi:hypothetical protein